MFCPKCGTKNPETGKFCRSCGTDLGSVSEALSGKLAQNQPSFFVDKKEDTKSKDPSEIIGEGVREIIIGIGFLVAAFTLFYTGIWGGHSWWWAMLFPAFISLAKGISDIVKYGVITGNQVSSAGNLQNTANQTQTLNQPPAGAALPPTQTEYVAPETRYKTGDLVPPSVTEPTTRLLEMDSEGETMTLPKK
jgi:hypothetical protein